MNKTDKLQIQIKWAQAKKKCKELLQYNTITNL